MVSLLAMISVAKLLTAKKKRAQEIRGKEVDTPEFEEARQKELQSFIDIETYAEVDDDGQQAISTRWGYTYKPLPDGGSKPKARLVARGYEDRDIHLLDTSSPTCTKANFRLALALSRTFGWVPHDIDVKTAILQGKELQRTVYLRPPKDLYSRKRGTLRKLKKSVYGLGDAPKLWFESLTDHLKTTDALWSPTYPTFLWWKHADGRLRGLMCKPWMHRRQAVKRPAVENNTPVTMGFKL